MSKRFLLADDHSIIRSGLSTFIRSIYPTALIDEAFDETTILLKLASGNYDLIVMDMQMPNTNTFGLLEHIHIKYSTMPVLMFTMNSERAFALRTLKAGAKGFLSKEAPIEEMKKAFDLVLNNKKYISDELASLLADHTFNSTTGNPFNSLSAREFELVNLLLTGKTLSEITRILNIQMSTASTHKARIFTKLGVNNMFELKELSMSYEL